jgi:hypothetical protein
VPIQSVRVGDTIEATDPLTGVTKPEKVQAVIRTLTDTDFTDLTIVGGVGADPIVTSTQHHPYWDVTRHRWLDAADIHPGDTLRTPNGPAVHVTRVRNHTGHIVTYNLTVSELHTYYVVAGGTPILVHNCNTLSFKAGEADIHYRKHVLGVLKSGAPKPGGADMPEFLDKADYVRGARDLLDGDPGEGVLEATRGTDTLRFDTTTGEFDVKTSDGIIRTFFRPGGGEGYFRTLPGLTRVNY